MTDRVVIGTSKREVLAGVEIEGSAVAGISAGLLCTKRFAPNAAKNAKCRLSQRATELFSAVIVLSAREMQAREGRETSNNAGPALTTSECSKRYAVSAETNAKFRSVRLTASQFFASNVLTKAEIPAEPKALTRLKASLKC